MPSWNEVRGKYRGTMKGDTIDCLLDALVDFPFVEYGVAVDVLDRKEEGPSEVLVDLAEWLLDAMLDPMLPERSEWSR